MSIFSILSWKLFLLLLFFINIYLLLLFRITRCEKFHDFLKQSLFTQYFSGSRPFTWTKIQILPFGIVDMDLCHSFYMFIFVKICAFISMFIILKNLKVLNQSKLFLNKILWRFI